MVMRITRPDREPDFCFSYVSFWIKERIVDRERGGPERLYICDLKDELYVETPPTEGGGGKFVNEKIHKAYREYLIEKTLFGE